MKKLFDYADHYCKQTNWKDMSLLKTCLCAIGVLIGLCVPKEKKRPVFLGAALLFAATYVPLMAKFIRVTAGYHKELQNEEPEYYEMED